MAGCDNRSVPLSSSIVGIRSSPIGTTVDARWLMAYAAGVGDTDPCLFATEDAAGVVAHPLFPVCVEWQTGQAVSPPGAHGLTLDELRRGVHLAHDLVLHRPLRGPVRVTTEAEIVGVARHRSGAVLTTRIDATADSVPQWTTWMTSLLRGVDVLGDDRTADQPLPRPPVQGSPTTPWALPIAAGAAHVYTECARIWNPIHTDDTVAHAAGLPGTILHGTATLAMAVSTVTARVGARPEDVERVAGRFGAMVPMPTTLTVRVADAGPDGVAFDVLTADGRPAVRDGWVGLRSRR